MSETPTETGTVVVPTPQPVIGDAPATGNTLLPQPSVREWAQANGYEVKATGRLPKVVVEAYAEANGA